MYIAHVCPLAYMHSWENLCAFCIRRNLLASVSEAMILQDNPTQSPVCLAWTKIHRPLTDLVSCIQFLPFMPYWGQGDFLPQEYPRLKSIPASSDTPTWSILLGSRTSSVLYVAHDHSVMATQTLVWPFSVLPWIWLQAFAVSLTLRLFHCPEQFPLEAPSS